MVFFVGLVFECSGAESGDDGGGDGDDGGGDGDDGGDGDGDDGGDGDGDDGRGDGNVAKLATEVRAEQVGSSPVLFTPGVAMASSK